MLQTFRESSIGKVAAFAIIGLIAVSFVFFGRSFNFGFTGSTFAAKVNGEEIPMLEFERDLQQYQNQYQQAFRVELTEDLRREMRRIVIDRMVLDEALRQQSEAAGYRVSNERLAEALRGTEAFQAGGEFSGDVYRARLNANGLTPAGYEALLRRQLALAEIQNGIAASTFLTPAEYRRYIELYNERREIAYALFAIEDFLAQVEIGEEAVAEYHAANASQFMSEETVDLEYVELTLASIAAGVEVTEDDLRAYYDEQQEQFSTPEERHVRHILIEVQGDDRQAAEAEAQAVRERLDAGEDFAALARELSDDRGTSADGGDLGWIGRGFLTGPFEDALFAMAVGDVSGPVETEFGYHILRLEDVRGGEVRSFEDVHDELLAQLREDRAAQRFFDVAKELDLQAFEAVNDLQGVAERMGLELKTIEGFSRRGDPDVFADSGPVVAAVFDEDAIATGDNTNAVELSDEDVVVARVTAHHPPEPEALDDVADEIRDLLARRAAGALVGEAAQAFFAELEGSASDAEPQPEAVSGTDAVDEAELAARHGGQWFAARFVERTDAQVPAELLSVAFSQAKPGEGQVARRLVPLGSGDEAVLVLSAVELGQPGLVPQEERDQRQRELADQAAQTEIFGYAGDVRDRATVRIPDVVLNPQL